MWRSDLLATEPFWEGNSHLPTSYYLLTLEWYDGLSKKFLSVRCARILVLAGQERLDRDLMVGQM